MSAPKLFENPVKAEATFSATRGLCNECGELCDAKIVTREAKVYLAKFCPQHGRSEALFCSDLDWYRRSLAYVKPATEPKDHSVKKHGGCPTSCGLCPEHQQHSCVPILEITQDCNMQCPICLVGDKADTHLSLEEVDKIVDTLVRCEGKINMLNLSGGEPTTHPQFLEIVDRVRRPEIGIISVSTNGLRLAEDDELIRALAERNVVISLQFDGTTPETYEKLRGQPELAAMKLRLINRAIELGAKLSLTVTLAKGVNEAELAGVLDLLFNNDQILSVMVQPLTQAGRAPEHFLPHDPMDALTIPDVAALLAEHSGGVLEKEDFAPLPCSHPSCFALTYVLKNDNGTLTPLPRMVPLDDYLDIIKNQALLNTDPDTLLKIRDALYELWSSDGSIPQREAVLKTVKGILLDLNKLGPEASHREVLDVGQHHVKSIFIHHFMDRYTFDLSRAVKCCNHYPNSDGRLFPACIRNNGLIKGVKTGANA